MQPPKAFTPPPKPDMTPYEEHMIVSTAAVKAGLIARSWQNIKIDLRKLDKRWLKPQPDMRAIRRELRAGRDVPGAEWGGWSYVLEPIAERKEDDGEDNG